jgi:chromate transporter
VAAVAAGRRRAGRGASGSCCWRSGAAGLFGFGGGPSFIPLVEREVLAHGWLTREGFLDAFAFGNALPGPITTKLAGYVGYRVAGWPGAIVALIGLTVPTILAMVALSALYGRYQDAALLERFLAGLRPVVIALLLLVVLGFAPSALAPAGRLRARLALGAGGRRVRSRGLVACTPRSSSSRAGCSGWCSRGARERPLGAIRLVRPRRSVRLRRRALDDPAHPGRGRRAPRLADADAFLDAFAFGNALPGPIATKLAGYVGFQVAGVAGAAAGLVGVTLPTIVAMVALAGAYARYRDHSAVRRFLAGVRPVVLALLALVVWDFAPAALLAAPVWWANLPLWAIAALAVLVSLRRDPHPALLIVAGGVLGLLVAP